MSLVFLDTETTGLDPALHEVWEIAYAVDDGPIRQAVVPHQIRTADPEALTMNGYHDNAWKPMPEFDSQVRAALTGNTLVGANPAFDAAFLRARWGVAPWHHRLWDVEAYAAGVLNLDAPPGLSSIVGLLRERGMDVPAPDHTAAGDVDTLRTCFRHLRAIASQP